MDPEAGVLQRLLLSDEYSDLEDIIVVEGTFVELDKRGDALQQVVMGMSPDHFFMSRRRILNWKEDLLVISELDADLLTYDLELKWITPLRFLDISSTSERFILRISSKHMRCRYFELCTGPERNHTWFKWEERISYMKDDPYGYINNMRLRRDSRMSLVSAEPGLSSGSSSDSFKSGTLELDLLSSSDEHAHEEAKEEQEVSMSDAKPLMKNGSIVKNGKRKQVFKRLWHRLQKHKSSK